MWAVIIKTPLYLFLDPLPPSLSLARLLLVAQRERWNRQVSRSRYKTVDVFVRCSTDSADTLA